MNKIKKLLFLLLTFMSCIVFLNAESIDLKSETGVVLESSTNKVLFEKDKDKTMAPASMTKIMTMLLIEEALENGSLKKDDVVTISENAANMGGSQIYLEAGSEASVEELLTSIAVGSANDAAVAMAEKIGGTEENFVKMMNDKAKMLGALNTVFKNPHGLDEEGHLTTAYDMALIASELVKHEDIIKYTSTYETTINHSNGNSIWLVNTNSLIRFYSGLDGLKTGFTENAGYCLTGTMEREGMRLITVVMNAKTKEERNTDTINLMEQAYSMYSKKTIIKSSEVLGKVFVNNSKKREISYYLKNNANVIIDKNTRDITYSSEIELDKIKAPLKSGDKIGTLTLNYNNSSLEYDVIVKEEVKKANVFRIALNYFKDIVSGNVSVI